MEPSTRETLALLGILAAAAAVASFLLLMLSRPAHASHKECRRAAEGCQAAAAAADERCETVEHACGHAEQTCRAAAEECRQLAVPDCVCMPTFAAPTRFREHRERRDGSLHPTRRVWVAE